MAVRTLEELSDDVAQELAWRKKELASLKSLVSRGGLDTSKKRVLLRSGVAILYGHWEGFVKAAGRKYLEYVARRRLPHSELADNFVAVDLESLLNRAADGGAEVRTQLVHVLRKETGTQSDISYRSAIPARGNLNSDRLKNIVMTLGLDYSLFATKEKLIDERLVGVRNDIAHGQYEVVDKAEYDELHEQVLVLMEIFRNEVENAAATDRYRAA